MFTSKYFNLFASVTSLIFILNCSSYKNGELEPPFNIKEVYKTAYVAGVQGGGAGINFVMQLETPLEDEIVLDSVYHKNRVSKLDQNPNNPLLYSANIELDQNQIENITISSDMDEELSNELPKFRKMPLDADSDEFVILYKIKGKSYYFKLDKVEERAPKRYPQ